MSWVFVLLANQKSRSLVTTQANVAGHLLLLCQPPQLPFAALAFFEQFGCRPDDLLNLVSQVSALEIITIGFEANPHFHHPSQALRNPLNLLLGWPLNGALSCPYDEELVIEIPALSLARQARSPHSKFGRFLITYYHGSTLRLVAEGQVL